MKEIFGETLQLLYGSINPYEDLDTFVSMDDWGVLYGVKEWLKTGDKKRKAIASEWKSIMDRQPTKWRCLHSFPKDYQTVDELSQIPTSDYWESLVRKQLGSTGDSLKFKIDRVEEDPRRLDPLSEIVDLKQVKIYNPATQNVDYGETERIANRLPAKSIIFRLYALRTKDRKHDRELRDAFEFVFKVGVVQKRGSQTST